MDPLQRGKRRRGDYSSLTGSRLSAGQPVGGRAAASSAAASAGRVAARGASAAAAQEPDEASDDEDEFELSLSEGSDSEADDGGKHSGSPTVDEAREFVAAAA